VFCPDLAIGGGRLEGASGGLDKTPKVFRCLDCQLREYAPVDSDSGQLESVNEAAVVQIVPLQPGIDPDDHQRPECAFLATAFPVGTYQSVHNLVTRALVEF
jgi:hypothetical protein